MAADLQVPTLPSDDVGLGVMLRHSDEVRVVQAFFQSQRGYFVDVGANEPIERSQTFHLEQLGWSGVLIEPQPDLAEALRRGRKARVYAVACSSPENSGRLMPLKLADAYSTLNTLTLVATANVTGTVAANTAIGRLDASMLDTATTSSMTNSMKVLEPSSWPTGCTRLYIQASP